MPTLNTEPQLLIDGRPVHGSYEVTRELIDVTTEYEADPNWRHVDSHGHVHRWMAGPDPVVPLTESHLHYLHPEQRPVLPSLVNVGDPEPHWCELCHGEYQPTHYECRLCGDVVKPRSRRTVGRRHIPGLKSIEFEVEEYLPLGDVMVTVPGDPPQTFPSRVVSSHIEHDINGRRGSSHIVPTGPPVPLDRPS